MATIWGLSPRNFRYSVLLTTQDGIYIFVILVFTESTNLPSLKVEESQATVWLREAFMGGGSSKHLFTIYDGDNYLVWKRHSDSSESRMRLRFVSSI